MSARFPLQRLLNLREQHEMAMARDLATARGAAEEERLAREALRKAREISLEHVARVTADGATMGTLVSLNLAMGQLDEHTEVADERTRAAEAIVDEAHEAFAAAARARQMLDRLRARHDETSRAEENARDLKSMDSIALSRFTQEERPETPPRNRPVR
jgi:flagellar FliJ protein